MQPVYIYSSQHKQKMRLEPIQGNQIKIYVCGPTVYDHAHLGHARSAIAFDLWWRVLEQSGYSVLMGRNFTDIDDKIIAKALKEGTDINTLSTHFIESYLTDMDALGVQRPHLEPKASACLDAIIAMIERLLENGHAYRTENHDIYLDTHTDHAYGSLSAHTHSEADMSRLEDNPYKRHPQDFALWKSYKGAEDVGYASPFGEGRPGWHIECSSMIFQTLAYQDQPYQIDIHAGGCDLLFPHHENEASQTRCAFDQELAKYWIHNGFVNISGQKMSKSLGNSFYIKDALKVYDGEILRNYLLGVHYRATLNFNEEDLLVSKKRLDKLYRLKQRALECADPKEASPTQAFQEAFLQALQDDLNISKALRILEEHVHECNDALNRASKKAKQTLSHTILQDLAYTNALLGLGDKNPTSYFQLGVNATFKAYIENQIALRAQAKQTKDFALADRIREDLLKQGIALMDTSSTTLWECIQG
ncbi:cysteine--tRNA ligase [Helicobacter baculiformis]|uniref:Cysteine--tRNA ligase n=1 Tax=Helicobacter baculiformis TaxID=427351 RepID=A0ABV7ZI44_9HELI|nr:cysteine--tRNA ligase [Helicobacter baculiformis]